MTPTFTVLPLPASGAEDVVVATSGPDEGSVFTGTEDGSIWKVAPDGRRIDLVARTGGRPLGLELDPEGRLIVCDARRGLLRVDTGDGSVELLADRVEGQTIVFCNNAAVAADGTIWFSDSSRIHSIEAWKKEMVEVTRTGRLLRRDPDGTVSQEIGGLRFANGVALSADEGYVVVAECGGRTVVRKWLTGDRAGEVELFADDLPGYPDNIARGSDGLIWVTIASPTDPVLERLQRSPLWVRRTATRIPDRLQPQPKRTVRVHAYDDSGRLVHDLSVDEAEHGVSYHMVTGVREHDGRVWMGSLVEPAIAVLDR